MIKIPKEWTPSNPATRGASEEDLIQHVSWPRDWSDPPSVMEKKSRERLERLIQLGLPFSTNAGERRFDPYEVFYFIRWAHYRKGDSIWPEALSLARCYAKEHLPAFSPSKHFEIRFETEGDLRWRKAGSQVRLQYPLPKADGEQKLDLKLEETTPGSETRLEDGVLDIRATVPMAEPATLRTVLRMGLDVGWRGTEVDPARVAPSRTEQTPENQDYLAPFEGPIQVTDAVKKLANELSGRAKTNWDAVLNFWDFLIGNFEYGRLHPHETDASDPLGSILHSRRTDCFHGAAFLASLCRARGIPARLVSGYFLYTRIQTKHWWVEIQIEPYGWLPFDLWSATLADGETESEWSRFFLGRLDPRLVVDRFPRAHVLLELPVPETAYWLERIRMENGNFSVETIARDGASGTVLCRDRFSILTKE